MAFVSNALGIVGTLLSLVTLVFLVRGPLSRYFGLFLFLLTSSGAWILMGWVLLTQGPRNSALYRNVYWGSELLLDLLVFFLVIWLTARTLEGSPMRSKALRLLGGILVVVLATPFVLFHSHQIYSSWWNQRVAQLLNFGAGIMNLALWSTLLFTRQRDKQLLAVCAGLGVIVTGAALTLGVRLLTDEDSVLRNIADAVYRLTQIAGPAIWCWAFRPRKPKAAPTAPAEHRGEAPDATPSVS